MIKTTILIAAFGNMIGKFPFCVLYVTYHMSHVTLLL